MHTTRPAGLTPRDVARILFRHSRKIALIFFGVIALSLLVIAVFPRTYISESKLMIRIGRESVGLDPTATTGETITLQKNYEDEVNSAVNILTGRGILERVVERVGAERIIHEPRDVASPSDADGKIAGLLTSISDALEYVGLSDPVTQVDRAVRRLERKLEVWTPRHSMVVTVRYRAASPELAHEVVQAVTEEFLDEHARLSQTDGSLEFFSEQVDKLYRDLSAAQKELRDRKNEYQLTSSDSRRSVLEQRKNAMRQKVYDLKMQETDLMSRYTDEYPPLREIRRQHEMAEQLLLSMPFMAAQANGSESQSQVAENDRQAKVNPVSYQVVEPADDQHGELNAELHTLNDQEFELAQLEREVRLLEGKYAMHVEKLEQARVNDALGRERITNVKVAQPASLVHRPAAPNKPLLMIAALVIAIAGSVSTAYIAETVDQTLQTTDQVEAQLNLPVLASLPWRAPGREQSTVPAGVETSGAEPSPGSHQQGSYGALVTALRSISHEPGKVRAIGIVGCDEPQLWGRVATELATEAAAGEAGPVLLIDADARRQLVARRFHLNGAPGWRDALAGTAAIESCVQRPNADNLAIIAPGGTNGAAPAFGSAASTTEQLRQITAEFGLVVVDLPPATELDSSPAAGEWIDQAVLVVEAERTRVQAARRVQHVLELAGVQVTGVILANRREHIPRWLYQRL